MIKFNRFIPYSEWYGIEYDITSSSPTLTRIGGNMSYHKTLPAQNLLKACILKDDLSVNYYLNPSDWTKKDDNSVSNLDGTDGQVMIRKTKSLYWRFETSGNKIRVKVSLIPIPGFIEKPVWNIGAFEASLERSTNKLSSVVNSSTNYRGGNNNSAWDAQVNSLLGKPATAISRTNFRTYARNRGTGWNQLAYDSYLELFWLFAIEYATFNSQLPINNNLDVNGYKQGGLGNGVTNANSTEWNTFNGYYPFINCGASNSLGTGTGEVSTIITDFGGSGINRTFNVNRYRGIENPFGHIWKWIDGANIYNQTTGESGNNILWVIDNPSQFADNTSSNARYSGTIPTAEGWGKNMIFGNYGDFLPSSTGGSSTTYMCDYYYCSTTRGAWFALLVGGDSNVGSIAGLLISYTNTGASGTRAGIGGRLYAR